MSKMLTSISITGATSSKSFIEHYIIFINVLHKTCMSHSYMSKYLPPLTLGWTEFMNKKVEILRGLWGFIKLYVPHDVYVGFLYTKNSRGKVKACVQSSRHRTGEQSQCHRHADYIQAAGDAEMENEHLDNEFCTVSPSGMTLCSAECSNLWCLSTLQSWIAKFFSLVKSNKKVF